MLKINSAPAGPVPIPIEAGIQFDLSKDSNFGAVLLTEKPIAHEMYYGPDTPWNKWVEANTTRLYSDYKTNLRKNGLWIITQVYSTKMAHITTLQSSKRSVQIGVKADVASFVKVEPHGDWSADADSGSWTKYTSRVCS